MFNFMQNLITFFVELLFATESGLSISFFI